MSDSVAIQAEYAALNKLIVDCPDFDRLEALLGGFNLFQVLKFEYGEIRHSNVLAWILDPSESHGLDSTFLKKWLMRVIHEASDETETPIAPVDIDGWQLLDVEVRREWRNIDLLLVLNFIDDEKWVVSIENKVNSAQHSDQLNRYRKIVEAEFSAATRRLFIFLTKGDEAPEDFAYLPASYTQVHKALSECLEGRSHAIGSEPKVLLENYLRLLEEKFMNESDIARTALKIYQQHKRALDVIFEHRPDSLQVTSDKVRQRLTENAERLGIIMESSNKSYLRFIPREWDQPGNTHGSAWASMNRSVVFEVSLNASKARLYVVAGNTPEAWIDPIWKRAAKAPFTRANRKERPRKFCPLHIMVDTKIALGDEDSEDPAELAKSIFDKCVNALNSPNTREVIEIIQNELPKLVQTNPA